MSRCICDQFINYKNTWPENGNFEGKYFGDFLCGPLLKILCFKFYDLCLSERLKSISQNTAFVSKIMVSMTSNCMIKINSQYFKSIPLRPQT